MTLSEARRILGISENSSHFEIKRQLRAGLKTARDASEKRKVMEAYNVATGSAPAIQLPAIFTGRAKQKKQSTPPPRSKPQQQQTTTKTSIVIYRRSIFYRAYHEHVSSGQGQTTTKAMPHGAAAFYKKILDQARSKLRMTFVTIFVATTIPTYLAVDNWRTIFPITEKVADRNVFAKFAHLYNPWPDIEDWKVPWFPVLEECLQYYDIEWDDGAGVAEWWKVAGLVEFHPNRGETSNRDRISSPPFPRRGIEYHDASVQQENGRYGVNKIGRSWQEVRSLAWSPRAFQSGSITPVFPDWFQTEFTTCELAAGFLYHHYSDTERYDREWWNTFGGIMLMIAMILGMIYRSKSKKIDRDYDEFISAIGA